jgi:putative peptidoglycan lipid II flippase
LTEHRERGAESVGRPAGLVSAATMCSRVLGLAREAVFAALFATRTVADAYVFAFRIPNLLRDFFAEGALSAAFVPAFARARTEQGEARAFRLAARVFGTLGAVAALIVLLGIVFAPAIVAVVAADAPADMRPLTITLTRVMFPFLFFVALAAVAMGVLNSHRRYFVPAVAPAFFNVAAVVGGGVLLLLDLPAETALVWWAAFVVLGGALQFLVQVPSLRAIGMRERPRVDWRLADERLRQVVRRMGPVVLSLAATNIMLVITTAMASRGEGWASSLNYAFRLVHLPIGVIGVALGTVVLAAGARLGAAADAAGLDDVVRRGVRLNWFLALPAATGLFVLAEPLVRLIFERGAFDRDSTELVASALRWYAGGIVFYAGVKAAAPQFLARGDTRTPMVCSLLAIAVNLALAFTLIGDLGHRALALAVAGGAATNYLALRLLGRRRFGPASAPGGGFLVRCVVAAAAMGGLGWLLSKTWLSGDRAATSGLLEVALTIGLVVALAGTYFVVAAALGIEEGRPWRAALRRRR